MLVHGTNLSYISSYGRGRIMEESRILISQAAKMVEEESHVLRFWEEKMNLPIKRNHKGQRCYTTKDIQIFKSIKELKNKGFTLDKITSLIPQLYGKVDDLPQEEIPKITNPEVTPATIDPGDLPIVEEPLVEPFEPTVPLTAPSHEDKIAKKEQFQEIMERLIQEVAFEKKAEGRFKSLDREIRSKQVSRKMVAATKEDTDNKKKIFKIK